MYVSRLDGTCHPLQQQKTRSIAQSDKFNSPLHQYTTVYRSKVWGRFYRCNKGSGISKDKVPDSATGKFRVQAS